MSRELTKSEMAIAAELCWQIREHDPSGTTDITGCPTCRADVVRLVDAPPRERVLEVSEAMVDAAFRTSRVVIPQSSRRPTRHQLREILAAACEVRDAR